MPTIPEAFAAAVEHQQAGRLEVAEQIFREILAVDPNHFDALHLVGVIASQRGDYEAAVAYLRKAIGVRGNEPTLYNDLGVTLVAGGRFDEAIASFMQALGMEPAYSEAHSN